MQRKLHGHIHTAVSLLLIAHRRLVSTRYANRSPMWTASVPREYLPEYHGGKTLLIASTKTAHRWISLVSFFKNLGCRGRKEAHAAVPTVSVGMTYNACDIPNTVEPSNMWPLVYVPFVVQLCFFALRIASIWKRQKQPWGLDDITFYISSVRTAHLPSVLSGWTCTGLWRTDNRMQAFLLASLPTLILGASLQLLFTLADLRISNSKM